MRKGVLVLSGVLAGVLGGGLDFAHAALVTQLDFTGGAVNGNFKQERAIERTFNQESSLTLGQYQSWGDIGDSKHGQYSLLTSNVLGAPAPSATIHGSSISVDLSSLFLAQKHGSELRLWNIGGQATGLYNPDTTEFSISWKNLLKDSSLESHRSGKSHHWRHEQSHHSSWQEKGGYDNPRQDWNASSGSSHGGGDPSTFFLQGKVVDAGPAPVALPAAVYLYSTGLLGVGYAWMKKRRATSTVTAAVPAA